MSTSVLSERSWASSRMMTLYLSRSPSFNDSRSKTPSVISAHVRERYENTITAKRQRRTFNLRFCRRAVFETNGISHCTTELALHLFADTFSDRHSGDTSRLCAADDTVRTIAVFVKELGQLGRFAGAGLSDNNDDCRGVSCYARGIRKCLDQPWLSRMTLSSSSRQANAGRYSLCSFKVRDFANALTPVAVLRCVANFESPL